MKEEEFSKNERKVIEHLERADDLGVSLREYSAAYDVNLKMLADGKALLKNRDWTNNNMGKSPPSDFVRVSISSEDSQSCSAVCSLSLSGGHTIQCNEWPPATWLQSLDGPAQ